MVKDEISLNGVIRKITEEKIFDEDGRFGAWGNAQTWLKEHGYSCGSMQGSEPIAVIKGNIRISKWRGLEAKDMKHLDGVILPMPDFTDGGAQVLIFEVPEEIRHARLERAAQQINSDTYREEE